MEPILVYGYPSGSSMGLVATLEWLGKSYKLSRVDMLGEMQQPAYKRLNPRVETPVFITDEGKVLTESMAIALWLASRDTERRVSFDPLSQDADRMHQLMALLAAVRRRLEENPAVQFATALENGEQVPDSGSLKGHVEIAEVIERFGT